MGKGREAAGPQHNNRDRGLYWKSHVFNHSTLWADSNSRPRLPEPPDRTPAKETIHGHFALTAPVRRDFVADDLAPGVSSVPSLGDRFTNSFSVFVRQGAVEA